MKILIVMGFILGGFASINVNAQVDSQNSSSVNECNNIQSNMKTKVFAFNKFYFDNFYQAFDFSLVRKHKAEKMGGVIMAGLNKKTNGERLPQNLDQLPEVYSKMSLISDQLSEVYEDVTHHNCFQYLDLWQTPNCKKAVQTLSTAYSELSDSLTHAADTSQKMLTAQMDKDVSNGPDDLTGQADKDTSKGLENDENFLSDNMAKYETALDDWRQSRVELMQYISNHGKASAHYRGKCSKNLL